jgi:hypothetical protein
MPPSDPAISGRLHAARLSSSSKWQAKTARSLAGRQRAWRLGSGLGRVPTRVPGSDRRPLPEHPIERLGKLSVEALPSSRFRPRLRANSPAASPSRLLLLARDVARGRECPPGGQHVCLTVACQSAKRFQERATPLRSRAAVVHGKGSHSSLSAVLSLESVASVGGCVSLSNPCTATMISSTIRGVSRTCVCCVAFSLGNRVTFCPTARALGQSVKFIGSTAGSESGAPHARRAHFC